MSGTQTVTRFLSIIAMLGLAAFSGVGAQETHAPGSSASGADYRSGLELETFSLINQYRKASNLPPLAWDSAITRLARGHSQDMATGEVDFGHDGFGERVSRLKAARAGFRGAGENVAMTENIDQVARNAVAMWLHSPHHLENIRGDYNYSGLGVCQNKNGAIYLTQIFLKVERPVQQAQAAPPPQFVMPFGMLLAMPRTRSGP